MLRQELPTDFAWTGVFDLRNMFFEDAESPQPPELYKAVHIRMRRIPPWKSLCLCSIIYIG